MFVLILACSQEDDYVGPKFAMSSVAAPSLAYLVSKLCVNVSHWVESHDQTATSVWCMPLGFGGSFFCPQQDASDAAVKVNPSFPFPG